MGARWSEAEIDMDLRRQVAAAVREDQRHTALIGKAIFEPDLPLAGLKARLLYEKLSKLGEVCYFDPPAENVEDRQQLDAVAFGVVTEKSPPAVRRLLRQAGIRWMAIEPLVSPFAAQPPSAVPTVYSQPRAAVPPSKPAETVRVDVERLDQLIGLVGQLSIGQSRLAEVGGQLKAAAAGHKPAEILAGELVEAIEMIELAGDGIQQAALGMRMVPIGPLFARFHRAIRDITRVSGKDIRLAIGGEHTELDKRMIDRLDDPLVHAIRNAADHGIESPEARAAAGKPRQGTILLDACHRGGNVVIRVSDDGRGLDAERLRARAVEMGLLSPADAQGMSPRELYRLAWTPGLSTAERLSDLSGRGMGMVIVRSRVAELGGSVELESEPGRGTTVIIKLPLTLAILPSLMAETDGEVFALPLESVVEVVEIDRRDVTTVRGRPAARLRGRVLPIITLAAVFNDSEPLLQRSSAGRNRQSPLGLRPAMPRGGADDHATLVVLGPPDRQFGLVVDRVLGEEDVVVKSLTANYHNVAGVTGAGISSKGRVFLILDPPALTENTQEHDS